MTPLPGWRTLLETAVLAPSPHNVQPWRVRIVGDGEAILLIERHRTLPKEDVTGSFIILTMGLFVESLRIVAAHHGARLDAELLDDLAAFRAERLEAVREPLVPFARLLLSPDPSIVPDVPLALFDARRTSRLPYRREDVDPAATRALAILAEQWGQRYQPIIDAKVIERVLGWNIDAVFEDLNHPPYRDELAGWIRYRRAASERARDGLDARCMNQAPLEMWLAFHAPWLLQMPVLSARFRSRYRAQIGPVTTLGLLSGPFWEPRDAYPAGRMLIRFWLECTRLGYYLHPYGNLVTNRSIAERVRATTGVPDVWLAFKIGRSDVPPRSHRLPVADILA
jgi:hypothetical protein